MDLLRTFPHMEALVRFSGTQADYYAQARQRSSFRGRAEALARLKETCLRHLASLFPEAGGPAVVLAGDWCKLSTAEHQGSISHPEMLNVLLNQAMWQPERSALLSLACASVKLDNELDSRFLHLGGDRLPLLPRSLANTMVLSAPPFDPAKVQGELLKSRELAALGKGQREAFLAWFEGICSGLERQDAFWKQMAMMNARLWRHFVPAGGLPLVPDYVMLPIERVVGDLVGADLASGRSDWLLRCLLEPDCARALQAALDGVRSCWNLAERKGTFLFWQVDARRRPRRLELQGNRLVSADGTLALDLDRTTLLQALRAGAILPSGALCLLYLAFYVGLHLAGGILQVNYLSAMKARLLASSLPCCTEADRLIIQEVITDVYLNFEIRPQSSGGLFRLHQGLDPDQYRRFTQLDFRSEIRGCLGFLAQLASA